MGNHNYRIFQIDDHSEVFRQKAFLPFDYVTEKFGGIDINDYTEVYKGEITGTNTIDILEEIFDIFNIRHPEDFHGHSLSSSGIVILDGVAWYCDSIGWKQLSIEL